MLKEPWRQFAGLGTAFADKYRFDQFFRTTWNLIFLQVGYTLLILALMTIAFNYLYRDISATLIEDITQNIRNGSLSIDSEAIVGRLQDVRTNNLLLVAGIVVLLTAAIGYVIARVTLAPTRNALAAQKQFIGNIAHELRTPLSIIKTNTEVSLLDSTIDVGLQRTMRSNIEELDRISEIINNLLTFSAYVRPDRMEFANVDLGDVVDTAAGKLAYLSRRKQIDVAVRKNDFRLVWGNGTALEQIVTNLLKNAISYTPDRGRISVTVEPNYRGFIELVIKDTGIGIARRDLFRIFEPFYRTDRSRARRKGGSGLGLAIVNELVKVHHGTIKVLSAPGRGTTVFVLLPCGKRPPSGPDGAKRDEKDYEGFEEIAADFSSRNNTNAPT